MSLIQQALDRAENPELEVPEDSKNGHVKTIPLTAPVKETDSEASTSIAVPRPSVIIHPASSNLTKQKKEEMLRHDSPRLNAIRFYEAENQMLEEAIGKTAQVRPKVKREARKKAPEAKSKEASARNFAGLILLLLIFTFGAVRFIFPPAETKIQEPAAARTAAFIQSPQSVVVKTQRPFLSSKPISQVKFMLTGITASGDTALAVINNQVVAAGDKLREGAAVKSITANLVILDFEGQQVLLDF